MESRAALVASLTNAIEAAVAAGDDETAAVLGQRIAKVLTRAGDGVASLEEARKSKRR